MHSVGRIIALLAFSTPAALSALEIAGPYGPQMILPAGRPFTIRGTGAGPSGVVLRLGELEVGGVAGTAGDWQVSIPALAAELEGRDLEIRSDGSSLILRDVLVGQVWLCAGQSNMDFPLESAVGGVTEAGEAEKLAGIRLMNRTGVHTQARRYNEGELARMTPRDYFQGSWKPASRTPATAFSAVGWWAGKEIHRKKGVPVGLIDVSVGGSGAEAWLPRELLEARADYASLLGPEWLESGRVSAWARGRAALNLDGRGVDHPFRPGFLFEAGVREWRGFPLSGVLWYQGETNAEIRDDAWNERLITDLVTGWRRELDQPDLPFLMVQLPRIGGTDPLRKGWPQFREVQARAAAQLAGVRLIETVDLGWDSPDVHQPDKRPIGERLGRAAAAMER